MLTCYKNARLTSFEEKNLPLLVDALTPIWSPPVGDDSFKRFNVEFIVRNNIAENDLHFQLCDEKNSEFLSAAFLSKKGDGCKVEEWYQRECLRYPKELRAATDMSRTYLHLMDKKTLSLMKSGDIKLSLFVSRKGGAGSELLKRIFPKLFREGWKNLYLWTDCDCNWTWYEKHGFELIEEDTYAPFSEEGRDYKTYIFRTSLKGQSLPEGSAPW